jgi:hypothetical protein
MAIVYIEQRKKQKKMIFILVFVILATFFVVWQGVFKKPKSGNKGTEVSGFMFKKIEIDFKVLENPILKKLEDFTKILPFDQPRGRENPFLPY